MIACPACGRENPDDARFCSGCATPLDKAPIPSRSERKIVTVLFADLVGSTRRAEQLDPEDVGTAPRYLPRAGYGWSWSDSAGRWRNSSATLLWRSSVLPVSHEDDPERAVRAALAVRDSIADLNEEDPVLDLRVRIAVNTGEALVSLGARPELGGGDGRG